MIATLERHAAQLDDAQPAPRDAVVGRHLLQANHAVGQALQLQIVLARGAVVEQHHGGAAAHEQLLQRENLPPVAQRVARQQPHLRQRIEDDAGRLDSIDDRHDRLGRLAEFHFRRMEHRVLVFGQDGGVRRRQLVDGDAGEIEAMGGRGGAQLRFGFGQRYIQHRLAALRPVHQELHRERRLAGAGIAFDQVDAIARQAAAQQVVESGDTGGRKAPGRGGWGSGADHRRSLATGKTQA